MMENIDMSIILKEIQNSLMLKLSQDFKKMVLEPVSMYAWSSVSPLSVVKFPFGLYMDADKMLNEVYV